MNNFSLNRRAFLKSAGKASGFVVLAGGVVQLTSFNAWAAKKTSLDSHSAKTMLLVVKDMFPAKRFSDDLYMICLLYTSPSPRDRTRARMPSSA